MTLGCFTGFLRYLSGIVTDSRRDATPVEPLGTLKDLIEVELFSLGLGNSRMGTVVDDLARTHRGACLCIVQTDTVTTTDDVAGVDTVTAQGVDGDLTNLMLGQLGHKHSLMTIVGQAHRHISLTATVNDTEMVCLNETVIPVEKGGA